MKTPYILKLKIGSADLETLGADRAKITAMLERNAEIKKLLAECERDRPVYAKAISDLEMQTHHTDEESVHALVLKRHQLELILAKVPRLNQELQSQPEKLFTLLNEAGAHIQTAMAETMQTLFEQVKDTLRPAFGNMGEDDLIHAVSNSPVMSSFRAFYHRNPRNGNPFAGGPANAFQYAPEAVAFLDDLLSGKVGWQFNGTSSQS